MGVEIERKFLVTGDGWRPDATSADAFEQGYLCVDPDRVVRVRVAGDRAWLTVKGRGTAVRAEYEYPVPVDDARGMLELAVSPPLRKTRHRVPAGPLTWEIDVFAGPLDGLVLAEIELPTLDTPFARPDWLGAEVTHDGRYSNAVLSERGLPG